MDADLQQFLFVDRISREPRVTSLSHPGLCDQQQHHPHHQHQQQHPYRAINIFSEPPHHILACKSSTSSSSSAAAGQASDVDCLGVSVPVGDVSMASYGLESGAEPLQRASSSSVTSVLHRSSSLSSSQTTDETTIDEKGKWKVVGVVGY